MELGVEGKPLLSEFCGEVREITFCDCTLSNVNHEAIYRQTSSIPSLFGLAIGIACAALIFLWVEDEMTFDNMNIKKDRLYSIQVNIPSGGSIYTIGSTPRPMGAALKKEIPGIVEAARNYGQQRMPFAMLSRSVAGFISDTLVLTFPGSARGVDETIDALFPQILHVFNVKEGKGH